jgi:hypothetical protein
MDTRELDRIGFVTRHFGDLQGLRTLVPLGMIWFSQGLARAVLFLPAPEMVQSVLFFSLVGGSFAAAMLLMFRSGPYYRRLLGEVEARREITLSMWLPTVVLASAVLLYLFATRSLSVPRVQCALFGSGLPAYWFIRECRWSQSYHLLLGGLLIALAVLGPGVYPAAQDAVASTVAGASWLIAGLLDHQQLLKTLGQLPPPDLDEAGAETPALAETPETEETR